MANNSAPCVLWSHLEHALESMVKYLMVCVCVKGSKMNHHRYVVIHYSWHMHTLGEGQEVMTSEN